MSFQSIKEQLASRINEVALVSSSLEDLSYASAALSKLAEVVPVITNPDIFNIGKPGTFGFGVSALQNDEIPQGWSAMSGHQDIVDPNYGNYMDPLGSHMVFIPKFWFKWDGNTPIISDKPAIGFVLHEAFRHAVKGFFRDKCHVSNAGGKPIAKIGGKPLSTHVDNNPISDLTGSPHNSYGGFVDAMKLRSNSHHCESVFEANALAILALAHSSASTNTAVCAYKDSLPHMPKGNNNNALGDANDPNISFTEAGYSASALTGSGFPFAKTTHNGQSCGVTDVSGNLWRVNIGMTKANSTDSIFQILKTSVNPNDLTRANLHDANLYDLISLAGIMPASNDSDLSLGNGANQVFSTNQLVNGVENDIRVSCAGIPASNGVSSGGTSTFAQDKVWRHWRANLVPIAGGNWNGSSSAGAFARLLSFASSDSSPSVGGSACVTL